MKHVRLLVGLVCLAACEAQAAETRPNIILVLADDMGYGDVAAHGNPLVKTPNLDRMHAESTRFTDFRVSPTCSPTRAALITGRHEFKSGVTHTIFERERLSLKATTVATLLSRAGYATGIFGKWHLGDEAPYQPDRRGFEEVFIHGGGGIGQKFPGSCADAPGNRYFDPVILHNRKFEKTHGYCTDVFFDQATSWIERCQAADKPFFAWLALNAAHEPLDCPAQWSQPYEVKVPPDIAKFYGMIANIDHNVGRLLARLRQLDLERNTLVVFMTDNGGYPPATKLYNAGMFGTKVTADNGGTRAVSLWRWPGKVSAGDRPQLTAHVDFFPTLAELAGATASEEVRAKLEGYSLRPLLDDPAAAWHDDRILISHVGRWGGGTPGAMPDKYGGQSGTCSVRWRNMLLVRRDNKWALFDLAADPAESNNLAGEQPELVSRLDKAFDQWWDASLPCLENEQAFRTAPRVSPYHELYQQQFGASGPNEQK